MEEILGRLIILMLAMVGTAVGYELWGADQFGLPRVFPDQHPLIGSWQEADNGYQRIVEFKNDHSGSFIIPPSEDQSELVEIAFAWTTRSDDRDNEDGRLQISFDRTAFTGRAGDNVSAPCQYAISFEQVSEEVEEVSLVLDGNPECAAFWGEYRQPSEEDGEGA